MNPEELGEHIGPDVEIEPYHLTLLKAWMFLHKARPVTRTFGGLGSGVEIGRLALADILAYAADFPDQVITKTHFVRMILAIDDEFLKHGLRESDTPRSR